jgi:hypothetical protein
MRTNTIFFFLTLRNIALNPFKSTSLESDTNDTPLFTRMIYVVQQGWGGWGGGFPRTSGNCEEYYRVGNIYDISGTFVLALPGIYVVHKKVH